MPRESFEHRKERVAAIIAGLKKAYPGAKCELNFENPLELLIATILSAQCTDVLVNLVTPAVFKKYASAADFANAPAAQFEQDIKRIGLYRGKSKNIQAACRILVEKYKGEVPRSMEELIELPGIGRKTANVVLGNAFSISVGIVVDTHVARLSGRLELTQETSAEKIEIDLQALVPPEEWTLFSHLLIWHGRRRCFARKPDCPGCEINALCPTGQRVLRGEPLEKPERAKRAR